MADSQQPSPDTPANEPLLAEEMDQRGEPLSGVEKKLIGYSLVIGVVLLVILVLATSSLRG